MAPEVTRLSLSAEDLRRVEEVNRLARSGAESVEALLALLVEPSWAVRRAVVRALAELGTPAIAPLCAGLSSDRRSEARLAATVDALVASAGDADDLVLELAASASSPAILCDAAQILGRRRSARAVPVLARMSTHEDDNVAVAAIEALGRVGGAAAVEPLLAVLATRTFFRSFAAIEVLGKTGDPRVVLPLAALLSEPAYAPDAAAALGRTGQVSAVGPLTDLLLAADQALTVLAARALTDLSAHYAENFDDVAPVVRAFRERAAPARAAARLLVAIERATPEDRVALSGVLGWVEDPRVLTKLVALLDDDPAVAIEASKALNRLGGVAETALLAALRGAESEKRLRLIPLLPSKRSCVPGLVECLSDGDPSVRAAAADALAKVGDPDAVPALFALIGDADARVSQAAVGALQSLGSAETKTRALAAARAGDPRTRRAGLRIISYFGYAEGLEILVAATTDSDDRLRDAATQGLGYMDDPTALAVLLKLTSHASARTRASAMRALTTTTLAEPIREALRRGLGDEDAWVRYYSCQSLGKLGDVASAGEIVALMRDPAGQVRVAAIESIARLGGPHAVAALDAAIQSDDPDARRAAVLGIGSTRRADALPVLLRELRSSDAATRLVTLSALAEQPAPEAFNALVGAAVADADPAVQSAARSLLETHPSARLTPWLIEQLANDSMRPWALGVLGTPREDRIEQILFALDAADSTLAPHLVAALTRMKGTAGHAPVITLLRSENVFARRAAVSALAAMASEDARRALARAAVTDTDDEVRRMCAAGLSA